MKWTFKPYLVPGATPKGVLTAPGHRRLALRPGAALTQVGGTYWAFLGSEVYNTSRPEVARALRRAVLAYVVHPTKRPPPWPLR